MNNPVNNMEDSGSVSIHQPSIGLLIAIQSCSDYGGFVVYQAFLISADGNHDTVRSPGRRKIIAVQSIGNDTYGGLDSNLLGLNPGKKRLFSILSPMQDLYNYCLVARRV